MAPWQHYGSLVLFFFHSYSPRPFADAHARPRSSPDWMALCQPATAIALICSSSLPLSLRFHPSLFPSFHSPVSESFTVASLCIKCLCVYTNAQHYLADAHTTFPPLHIVAFCSHVEAFFWNLTESLCDCPLGNYCSGYLFHRDELRKTKRALSLDKACVVLINFHQPPSCVLHFTSLRGLFQAVALHTPTIQQHD